MPKIGFILFIMVFNSAFAQNDSISTIEEKDIQIILNLDSLAYTPCQVMLERLPNSSKIRQMFDAYYTFCICSADDVLKLQRQIDRYQRVGDEFLRWDSILLEFVYREVTLKPIAYSSKEEAEECMKKLKEWQKKHPDIDTLPYEFIIDLYKQGCFDVEFGDN